MNYYERHLGDYARDAGHLSMIEHGAYSLLLDRIYTTEEGIPADQAHRVCRARSKEERAAVDAVLQEFFTLSDGVWTNSRAAKEITKMRAKVEAARTNGQRGGRPKRNPTGTDEKPSGLLLGSISETQDKAHQSPDTSHQEYKSGDTAHAPSDEGHMPTPAGLACRAIKAAGIADVNPGHPDLRRLLDAGVPIPEFESTAAELVGKGKPKFLLLLATVEGRRRDAEAAGAAPKTAPVDPKRAAKEAADAAAEAEFRQQQQRAAAEAKGAIARPPVALVAALKQKLAEASLAPVGNGAQHEA